jgi:hypothetical protein
MTGELKILFENIKNFRHLLTEAVGDDAIIKAINNHEYIYVYYEGDESNQKGYRTIRPYVLGTSSAGNKVIRAWQERGKSASYSSAQRGVEHDYWHDNDGKIKPGWRMFRLDKISSSYPTGKKFNNADGTVMIPPKYKEGSDANMSNIIAYVSTKKEPEFVPRTPTTRPDGGRFKRFANANKEHRKITPDDVMKLYDIAKRVYKKSAGKYLVVINDNDEYELLDANQKNNIPEKAVVGNLPNLYDTLVKRTAPGQNDVFFKDTLNKTNTELKNQTIPFERKTFFKQ